MMSACLRRAFLVVWFALAVLLLPSQARAIPPGVSAPCLLLAQQQQSDGKKKSWWKQFVEWLDKYASSKTGMIQIGVLGVLLSLYIITRKDGPK